MCLNSLERFDPCGLIGRIIPTCRKSDSPRIPEIGKCLILIGEPREVRHGGSGAIA